MSGHTPGPWFAVPYGDGNDTVICRDEAGNQRIAFMAIPGSRYEGDRRKSWAEIKANAAFIVRACNSHYELLEALELAANRLSRCSIDYDTRSRQFFEVKEWAEEARAAIAKAKGDAA